MKLKNIPNILSTIRLVLVFVYAVVYYFLRTNGQPLYWALVIFVIAGVTDVIDGYLARKYNWISDLGKILDPLADKMMQCTALICLMISGLIPIWFALPFIAKELLMLIGGLFIMREKKVIVVSNISGKLAALFFYLVIGLVMLLGDSLGATLTDILCGISLGLTVMALFVYFFTYFSKPKDEEHK